MAAAAKAHALDRVRISSTVPTDDRIVALVVRRCRDAEHVLEVTAGAVDS